ncbi:hypothetical protein BVRB_034790, partial [Beta vulgaris subsp. vulgaris]
LVPNSVLSKIVHEKLSTLENEHPSALDPTLVDIFQRIKDNSQDAIRELSQYLASNPCVDLEHYLIDVHFFLKLLTQSNDPSQVPEHVKQAVVRRMSLIEAPAASAASTPESTTSTLELFQARLKSLQSRASSQDPPLQRTVSTCSTVELPSASISRIRERLQMAQNSAEPRVSYPSVSVSGSLQSDNSAADSQPRPAVASLDAIRARIAKLRAASTSSLLQ